MREFLCGSLKDIDRDRIRMCMPIRTCTHGNGDPNLLFWGFPSSHIE